MFTCISIRSVIDINKAVLLGRLTKDPEIRYSQSAEPVCIAKYTLAVNRRFKREGEPDADFIPCVAFGKAGTFAEKYFKKGMQICISGRIQTRNYDKDGNKVYVTEIVIEEQDFAESKKSGQEQSKPAEPQGFEGISESIDDDDLPF